MRASRTAWLLVVVLLLVVGAVGRASARDAANLKIPPNEWGCTLCHNGADVRFDHVPPTQAASRTPFGQQWLTLAPSEIDRLWVAMAPANADGDGCSNGCELRDPFGSYQPGGDPPNTSCAQGDPNLADCTIPLDEDSWSTLKALFSDN